MKDETKKKKVTKKSKDQYKKGKAGVAARKAAAQKVTKKTPAKKKVEKKVAPKKVEEAKKTTAPKKVEKAESKSKTVTPKEVKKEESSFLEKTIIFDGKDRDNLREVVDKLEEETIVTKSRIVRRKKSNKIIIYILIALIFISIIGSTSYVVIKTVQKRTNEQTIGSDLREKAKKATKKGEKTNEPETQTEPKEEKEETYPHLKTLTLSEFKNIARNETKETLFLISSSTCLPCVEFEPLLEEELAKIDKTIYRIDIANFNKKEVNEFRTYYNFTLTPTVFVMDKKGVVIKDTASLKNTEGYTNKVLEWILNNLK